MKKMSTSLKYVMTLAALVLSANVMAGTGEWVASAQGYNNAQDVSSFDIDDVVSVTLDKGTNSNGPKYYNTGAALRLYGGNSMTIACASGKITGIVFTYGDGDSNYTNTISVDTGDFAGNSWEGSATSVTFTIGGTTGQRRIAKIEVTYGSGGGVVVKRPTISPEAGTYTEPIDVTITAETGLKVLYSMDNTTYNYYYSPIHLTESATIYAIAEDAAGNKSSVVSAEYKIVIYSNTLVNATGDFEPNNVNLPEELTYVWNNGNYGWVASAYLASASTGYEAESWLISPAFNINAGTTATLTFDHALNKGTKDAASVHVSEDKSNWTELTVPNWPEGNSWTFLSSGDIDLSAYAGKTIYIGFKYASTSTNTPSWEIKNFVLEGSGSVAEKPATTYESIAAAKAAATETKTKSILLLNNVTVTYVDGTNYYITDGSDGFLLYGAIPGLEPQVGDVLSGTIKGDLILYNGDLPEMTPAASGTEVTKVGTTDVVPEVVEMGDVLADGLAYSSKLVKLTDVMFGAAELDFPLNSQGKPANHGQVAIFSMGEESVLFDQFDQAKGLTFDTEAEDYEFSAIVSLHDGVVQFCPINKAELERDTPTPEYPTYESLAAIKAGAKATDEKDAVKSILKMNELLVSYANGKNVFVTDGTDGFLLFASGNTSFKAGDKISGDVTGNLWIRYGVPQLTYTIKDNDITVVSQDNTVTPMAARIPGLISNVEPYISMLVELTNVKFAAETLDNKNVIIMQGSDELTLRDNFGILADLTFDTEKAYTFKAIVAVYKKDAETEPVIQVYPVDRSEFITEQYVFDGDGTQDNPYSVADVRYLQLNSQAPAEKVWVKGTIIGTVNASFKEEKFANTEGNENLVTSNIVLADADTQSAGPRKAPAFDASKCIPVELKNNTVFREKLNLVDNFGNLGKEVLVKGNVTAYFSAPGVKNLDDAIIDGISLGVHGVEMDKEVLGGTIYTLSGQKVNSITRHGLYIIGGKKVFVK